jgi:hypothetical protein
MSTDNLIKDARIKFFAKTSRDSAADQIVLETRWTDHVQKLVDFGNKNYLKNFSLRLEMEYDDGLVEEKSRQ